MNEVIPIINKLQFVFKSTGAEEIQLPQIVVVGSQSCGKSSVLESLVGRSFLPRGSGIVTRCPIVLQLTHITEKQDGLEEWCIFADDQIKYTDYDKVRQKIEELTEKEAGNNLGISMEPIIVQVYSPNVVSLTVVDLPGIVKNPVGDQPQDIEQQVNQLIHSYIQNENALILAVSPANADIATSDSIKMAKLVDPNGERTLGVITKLDLMDKGTNAKKVLDGETIQVKLGIIGVVNRSQEDINNNSTIQEAMEKERIFLEENYPLNLGEIGSTFLASRLNELLVIHIKNALPALVKRINEMTAEYVLKKQELGPPLAEGGLELNHLILQAVENFIKDFDCQVKGRQQSTYSALAKKAMSTITVGANIAKIFDTFTVSLHRYCIDKKRLDAKQLEDALDSTVNVERFTSIEEVFKSLVRERISEMEKFSSTCADKVQEKLKEAIGNSLKDKRFQKLNEHIVSVTRKLLNSRLKETKAKIQEHISIQTGMIFSTDAKFVDLLKKSEKKDNNPATPFSFPISSTITNDSTQLAYVGNLVNTYVDVIRYQICDYMPKHIMFHLYESTMRQLSLEIRKSVTGKEQDIMKEPDVIIRRRKDTEEMLKCLEQAYEVISGIEDCASFSTFGTE